MRRDALGNVFPIQGAAGSLRIKNTPAPLQFASATANGQTITQGATIRIRAGDMLNIDVRTSQAVPRVYVFVDTIPWDRDLGSSDKVQWSTSMAGIAKGRYNLKLYTKNFNYEALTTPTPITFVLLVE